MASIGIDFGTSTSAISIFRGGKPEIIPNEYGNNRTASFVSWDSLSKIVVGDSAKDTASTNPTNTVTSLKTILGRKFNDPLVNSFATAIQYKIVDNGNIPFIKLTYQQRDGTPTPLISLEEAATRLFAEFKRSAELYLRKPVSNAVVTIPVYYRTAQREALKRAVKAANLNILRLPYEASAILTAYAFQHRAAGQDDYNVALVDFGAGSLQVAIANIWEGIAEFKSVKGNPEIGGDMIDLRLLDMLLGDIHRKLGIDLRQDQPSLRRLRSACERAKRELSSQLVTSVEIDALPGGFDYQSDISRNKLETICTDLFVSMTDTFDSALKGAKLEKKDILKVLLIGGSSKMPAVVDKVSGWFGRDAEKLQDTPQLASLGASILSGPAPDEPQDDAPTEQFLALEVANTAIGVETLGGAFTPIIPRNITIPTKSTKSFATGLDGQTRFIIKVYEGDRAKAADNTLLTVLDINDIPPAPKGSGIGGANTVDVRVEIDHNHEITIIAAHRATAREFSYHLSHEVISYDWSKKFGDSSLYAPLAVIAEPNFVRGYAERAMSPPPGFPQPRPSGSADPVPIIPQRDTAREDLEAYALGLRHASLKLNEASVDGLDFVRRDAAAGLTSSSVYVDKLKELKALCNNLLHDFGA
ncbi:Hsp70 protein-domain-containing protein [Cantharellus anzutake]|uniref:Hsp70 protein-domain-containing protein n=1 Tax=Cantharellus anzutake TaxID=1750568 RepID=UPI001903C940|nr:Hsp70 protein-domain-containing protein [Cantharellus anzutake]KAF8336523.1 Hsp70 protein-domain-containing protein [Cantharellus anzutake]